MRTRRDLLVRDGASAERARVQTQGRLQRILLHHTVHITDVGIEADGMTWQTSARVGRRIRRRVGRGVRGLHYQRVGVGVGSRCALIAIFAIRYRAVDVGSHMTLILWTVVAIVYVVAIFDAAGSMYCPTVLSIRSVVPIFVLRKSYNIF